MQARKEHLAHGLAGYEGEISSAVVYEVRGRYKEIDDYLNMEYEDLKKGE